MVIVEPRMILKIKLESATCNALAFFSPVLWPLAFKSLLRKQSSLSLCLTFPYSCLSALFPQTFQNHCLNSHNLDEFDCSILLPSELTLVLRKYLIFLHMKTSNLYARHPLIYQLIPTRISLRLNCLFSYITYNFLIFRSTRQTYINILIFANIINFVFPVPSWATPV